MTNNEIIAMAKKANNISEEAHTFSEWKRRGKAVRRGEHAAFKAKIWKYAEEIIEVEDGVFVKQERFVLQPASFFTASQVEE